MCLTFFWFWCWKLEKSIHFSSTVHSVENGTAGSCVKYLGNIYGTYVLEAFTGRVCVWCCSWFCSGLMELKLLAVAATAMVNGEFSNNEKWLNLEEVKSRLLKSEHEGISVMIDHQCIESNRENINYGMAMIFSLDSIILKINSQLDQLFLYF